MKKICGGATWGITFTSNNELCISRQNKARILNIENGYKIIREYGKVSNLSYCAVSPTKKYVTLVNTSGQIFAYDYESGERIFEHKKGTEQGSTQILFINNDEFILTDWDSNVFKVNLHTKSVTNIMKNPHVRYLENFLSDDKSQVIFFNEEIREYEMDSEIVIYDITDDGLEERKKYVYQNMSFESVSRCGDWFYCGIFDGDSYKIIKINANSHKKEDVCIFGTDIELSIKSITVSTNEKYIIVGSCCGIKIFDETGNLVCSKELGCVEELNFGDDRLLYIATRNGLYVCDVEKEIFAKEQKKPRRKKIKETSPELTNAMNTVLSLVENQSEYIRTHFDDEKVCMQKTDKTYIVVEIKTCKIIEYSKEEFEKNYDVNALEWI